MTTWSQAVMVAVLAVLVMSAVARPQYQMGYGTGPLSEAKLWRKKASADQQDYRAARAAAVIGLRLFRNSAAQANSIKDATPFYKYMRPKFATSYGTPADH